MLLPQYQEISITRTLNMKVMYTELILRLKQEMDILIKLFAPLKVNGSCAMSNGLSVNKRFRHFKSLME